MWKIKNIFKKKVNTPVVPDSSKVPQEEVGSLPTRKQIADFKFVDSSHHHPDFDPKKYTAPFLSNKCTQGTTFVDKTHASRKKICAENGIKYSGYHFYECRRDPIEQAKFYVKTHGEFTCAPQVDYESEERGLGQNEIMLKNHKEDLYKFLIEVERLTGKTPWIYVNYKAASFINFDKRFGRFHVWFARYNTYLGPIPAPWTIESTAAWQFTEKSKFPGFKGDCDVNIYFGKVNALGL